MVRQFDEMGGSSYCMVDRIGAVSSGSRLETQSDSCSEPCSKSCE